MNPILYLVVASAALSAAQLPTLPPGWTLPPGLTLPSSLPPLEDIWPRPVVDLPGYGKIRGGTAHSWYTGREYNFFHGVYYAKPTTSETRFLPPEPMDPYPADYIHDAYTVHGPCAQRMGSEDCLNLNIFTPNLPPNGTVPEKLLPVMYWIHGGKFSSGQTNMYTGFKYMEHDVVVVEVQYRLHALGFLCLDTPEVPGNAGIYDQIEGLKWVQKHIKYFGGDPDSVTIFGESAGSSSVALLMLIPQAKGLFHRVIGQSGSMLSDWALDRNASAHGYRIAELANCPTTPYSELISCLRTVPAEALAEAQYRFEREDRKNGGDGFGGASPVMQVAGENRLLTEEPGKLMDSGNYTTDVQIMFGANQQEGIYVLGDILKHYIRPNNLEFDEDFLTYGMMPMLLKVLGIRDDTGALADALMDKYLDGFPLGNFEVMIPGMIDVIGVFFLKAGGWNTVIKHHKHNPGNAYWYSYDFRSRFSILGSTDPIPQGINHADELQGLIVTPYLFNATENLLSKRMLQVWTNFAKYGNPTPDGVELMEGIPKFPPYDSINQPYMRIDAEWTVESDYTNAYTVMGDWYRKDNGSTTTAAPTPAPTSTAAPTPAPSTTAAPTPPPTTAPAATTIAVTATTDAAFVLLPSQALMFFFVLVGTLFF